MVYSRAHGESHHIYFFSSKEKSKLRNEQQRNKRKHVFKVNTGEMCKIEDHVL